MVSHARPLGTSGRRVRWEAGRDGRAEPRQRGFGKHALRLLIDDLRQGGVQVRIKIPAQYLLSHISDACSSGKRLADAVMKGLCASIEIARAHRPRSCTERRVL